MLGIFFLDSVQEVKIYNIWCVKAVHIINMITRNMIAVKTPNISIEKNS